MSRKIKINGQLVDFSTLVSTNADYKNKKWRYKQDGTMEVVTNETENDDDIVFSGSKSSLRRIADIERNISILSTKLLTSDTTDNFEDGVDNLFGTLFTDDVRFKGNVRIDHTPTIATDAATKGYVDTAVSNVSVNLTGYATETYVGTAISNLVDTAPTTLDTLNELAAALGDDPNFATTITNTLANKADTSSVPTDVSDLTDTTNLLGSGFSGAYADLTGAPTIPADVSDLTDTTNLLTHFSGSYDDLTDVPFSIESTVNTIFFDASTPNGMLVGDLWYSASNAKLYKAISNPNNATVDNTMVSSSPADIIFPAPGGTSVFLSNGYFGDRTVVFVTPITIAGFYGVQDEIALKSVTFEDDTVENFSGALTGEGVQVVGGIFNQGKKVKSMVFTRSNDPNGLSFNLIAAGAPIWEEVDPGYVTSADVTSTVTSSDLDMGTNKILYSNVYATTGDLPVAADYHGMFAHVHAEGRGYFAHAGSWVPLANQSELPSLSGYATETYVNTAIANLVDTAPTTLDTLNELAAALGDDPNFATTIVNSIPTTLTDLSITDGTANQVLTTDGAGNFTFVDASGGASVEVSGSAPTSPEIGDLWFDDASTGELYVYTGSAWITTADGGGGGSAGGSGASIELSDTAPLSPTNGALWFKTDTLNLYVYYSSSWVELGGGAGGSSGGGASVTVDTTAPANPSDGDLWYNTNYGDLLIYLGTGWVLAGASAGSSGSVWNTASTNITAIAGQKTIVDSSSGTVTVTLPASPELGDEIRIIDGTGSAATNNITINRNGNNIEGVAEDLVIDVNRAAFGLVYYNATQGWLFMEK